MDLMEIICIQPNDVPDQTSIFEDPFHYEPIKKSQRNLDWFDQISQHLEEKLPVIEY